MDCERTRHLLPWLLNGSLDEPERSAVREHLAGCAACRAELAETRLAGEIFGAHLPTEDLVAFAFDEPTSLDRALVARHVEVCERCADELALVAESRRLADEEPGAGAVVPFATREQRAAARESALRRRSAGWLSAIAAGLVAVVGLGGWTVSTQRAATLEQRLAAERREAAATAGRTEELAQRVAALNQQLGEQREQIAALERAQTPDRPPAAPGPAAGTGDELFVSQPFPLFPSETMRGGGPAAPPVVTLSIDPGSDQVVLEIELSDPRAHDSYEVRLLEPEGGVLVRRQAKPRNGYLNLGLPVEAVPRPRFTLEVRGVGDGGGEPVARFEVEVEG